MTPQTPQEPPGCPETAQEYVSGPVDTPTPARPSDRHTTTLGWTEHVEWEVLLPANAFRPEPRWAPVNLAAVESWRHEGALRSRRVRTEPWQQVDR